MKNILRPCAITFALPVAICQGAITPPGMPGAEPLPQVAKQHKLLAKQVGVWNAELRYVDFYGKDGSSHYVTVKGTSTREQPFGPRWLVERFEAEYQGVLYTGMGTLGYDPKKKKMVGTWIDSVTSSLMVVEGKMSDGGWLNLEGLGPDRNGDLVRTRLHTEWHSADKHTFYVFKRDAEDEWVDVMTITYTRAKQKPDKAPGKRKIGEKPIK